MSIFGELPKDLVEEEIVGRIPSRHLRRLRSTCKTWNRLFKNPRFATKHTKQASKELLVLMLTKGSRMCPVSINLDGVVPSVEVKSELPLIDPNTGDQLDISEVFHCDGLLLCAYYEKKSTRLVRLPSHCSEFNVVRLSVVREEKLSVLLHPIGSSKIEIWVTNQIDEINHVTWSKVLAFDTSRDHHLSRETTFFLDEEKKVALCCERSVDEDDIMDMNYIYSVGDDSKTLTPVYSGFVSIESPAPAIVNYVPSLVHIGSKRKRGP